MVTGTPLFHNRMEAGLLVARQLLEYAGRSDVVVVALPRGGVPVGYSIALTLQLPLDILLVRKLGLPGHEERAMGAIASGGLCELQTDLIEMLGVTPAMVQATIEKEGQELARRESLYRAQRPALQLHDHIVILVDDGLATGATMHVAVQAVRRQEPARIVIAVPVASPEAYRDLGAEADRIVSLFIPQPFYAVGLWYRDFAQTSDEEVMQLLQEAELAER